MVSKAMPESRNEKRLYWLLTLSGWLGMVGIEVTNYTFFIVQKFDWGFVILFVYGAMLGVLVTHLFRSMIRKLNVFEWRPRMIWALAFVSSLVMSVLMNLLFYVPSIIQTPGAASEIFSFIGLLGGTINWMRYVGVWVILYFMYHILERTRKIEEEKLKSENVARVTELELLKTQLNPHFLFNALNSIKALVSIDQEKSKDAIVKLSELLRFTLNYGNQERIPLHDELEEVKKYLLLEQIRFGSRLQVRYQIDDSALNRLIPPAIILTLAENAIKHGVAKQSGDCIVQIEVTLASSLVSIEMTNPGSIESKAQTGIGLQNIRKRLRHLCGEGSSFELTENNGLVTARIEIAEA
jgi:two-component system, LytTR family, sensor kinase